MVYYVKQGIMPDSRHTYMEKDHLLREELFGEESFEGPYSLIYHSEEPTDVVSLSRVEKKNVARDASEDGHRHFKAFELKPSGDFYSARIPLIFNDRIVIGIMKPEKDASTLFRHAVSEQLFYVHKGTGSIKSIFGNLHFRKGDYVYIPKGTIYYPEYVRGSEFLFLESRDRITIPQRYLNAYGQLREGSPYYTRDIRVPYLPYFDSVPGYSDVTVDFGDHYVLEHRDKDPFDVVGWDGYLYPFALNIENIAPIVGKLHMPPPVHETFSGKSFMLGTFLPRKFDFHPKAIPISYYHSNIDTDEILFYSSGSFMSRKGISEGSITVHVRGLIHGPQPGMVENAIGKEETDEVAVMIEAYDPVKTTPEARLIQDTHYMESWHR